MHDDLYLKAYETSESLNRAQRKKGVRRMRIYRRIASLLAASQFLILLMVSLFHHYASKPGVSKGSQRASSFEIARLDQGRNPAGENNPYEVVDVHRPPKPSPITPVGRTVVYVYAPPKPSPKTPVALTVVNVHPLPKPSPKTPVGLPKELEAPAPDLAPVSSPDRYALDRYLTDLPPPAPAIGPLRAAPAEASSGATSADANAVIAALQKYSAAWNTKHVAQITALRPGLRRRAVEQELSSASSIFMRIQATSVPRIQDNRATVECIHQVDQVFSDGVEKQNPGVKMTYVLVRRGSNWLIEDSR